MNGLTLHPSSIPIITERHGGRDNKRDATLRLHKVLRTAGHMVTVQGLHGARRELVGALREDVVERLAAAPDLDANVPAGGDHDAEGLVHNVGGDPLCAAGLEQGAHDVGVAIHGASTELGGLLRHGNGLDQLGVVFYDALTAAVICGTTVICGTASSLVFDRHAERRGRERRVGLLVL